MIYEQLNNIYKAYLDVVSGMSHFDVTFHHSAPYLCRIEVFQRHTDFDTDKMNQEEDKCLTLPLLLQGPFHSQ